MSASILEAVVRIRPDVDALRRDTRKAGDVVERELDKTGKKAGDKLGQGLADGMDPVKNGRLRDSRGRFVKALGDDVNNGLADGFRYDKNGRLRDAKGRFVGGFGQTGEEAGGRFSAAFAGKFQATGAAMTAGITLPVVAGFTMAVGAASDLGETVSANGVIFGDQAQAMEAWGDKAIETMGLAKNTAMGAANTFGAMFSSLGISTRDAATMAQELVARGRDIKSLYNAESTQSVLDAIRSAMAGETEPLRKFGVFLNEATINAKALSSGLVQADVDTVKLAQASARLEGAQRKAAEATADYGANSQQARAAQADLLAAEQALNNVMGGKVPELDAATKAQAIYQLVMEQSSIAAGDYARTQDSFANQAETNREKLTELAATFGERLLPVATQLLEVTGGLLDFFTRLPAPVQTGAVVLAAIAAAAGPLIGALGTLMLAWNGVAASAGRAAMAQQAAMAAGGAGRLGGLGMLGKGGVALGAGLAAYGGTKWLLENWEIFGGKSYAEWFPDTSAGRWLGDRLGGMATGGTISTAGLVTVGERGPEVLALPGGAQVSPNGGLTDLGVRLDRIADLLANSPGGMRVEVVNAAGMDERRLARELDALSRRASATRTTGRTR